MKKFTSLFTVLLILAVTAFAGPVDPQKAHDIAVSFWKSNVELNENAVLKLVLSDMPSKAPGVKGTVNAPAQYYIFGDADEKGFVIVSGDDLLAPVIGYSDNASTGEMPQALKDWLEAYGKYVDDVRAGIAEPIVNNVTADIPNIAPMLGTSWNQSAPYNNFCPSINGQRTPTGCTATAMAQIMKFHEHPAKPKKAISWNNNVTGKTETVDITKNTYDWANMVSH